MKEITIKLYSFKELSQSAKRYAIEECREYIPLSNPWAEENMNSVKAICKAINSDWDYYHTMIEVTSNESEEVQNLSGARAYAYVWNNYIEPNISKKYLKWSAKDKPLYAKIIKEYSCPFTGYCADDILWTAFEKWKAEVKKFNTEQTVDGFIARVQYEINDFIDKDDDYYQSDEHIEEELIDKSEVFTESGELY